MLFIVKKTLSAIAQSANDYLVKVKMNQPKLYQQIKEQYQTNLSQ